MTRLSCSVLEDSNAKERWSNRWDKRRGGVADKGFRYGGVRMVRRDKKSPIKNEVGSGYGVDLATPCLPSSYYHNNTLGGYWFSLQQINS
jgi:hypothetical protein